MSGCKLHVLVTVLLALCLAGCPTRPRVPVSTATQPVTGQSTVQPPGKHEGRPYDIVSAESLLTILVFRGGALAKAGHNHVIASHTLSGTIYVPTDLSRSTFEVRFPVTELTVDESALRAKENDPDFPPDIPDSAKDGTRRNLLSGALLDGEHYPEIVLRSEQLVHRAGDAEPQWLAQVQITVRDQAHSVTVPVHYEPTADGLVVSGELPLKQSDLGLTPFSALLGALQVLDDMKVRFRIVSRLAATKSAT